MRATFAGLVGFFLKHMAEKPGMHFGDGKLVDLLEIFDIAQFLIVKRKTVETVAFGVDVHRAVIGASKINILVFPFRDAGNGLTAMVEKSFYKRVLVFFNFV